jgi:hypothetical protein
MERQPVFASAILSTTRASNGERAGLVVLVKLGLARQDALASFALEMVVLEMLHESGLIWAIEATAWLQAMLVLLTAC